MRNTTKILSGLIITVALAVNGLAQELPTIAAHTEGLVKMDGFVPVYWDDSTGSVLLEVAAEGAPFLYQAILSGGLGSNDVGLDRGLLDRSRIVRFRRVGNRVFLFEENLKYRADSGNPDEARAVADAFASSILFGFDLVARTGDQLLVDATSFIVRDAIGIPRRLKSAGQGEFSLDAERSAPNPSVLKSFPDNTELEAWLTFSSTEPGAFVRDVASDPYSITLRVRHSLSRLPDAGYRRRAHDPRAGFFGITYTDYSTSISALKEQRYIARHRLEIDAAGRVIDPIVYYLDRGAPEPIRSALLDGAGWWASAFDEAGLTGGFRVELLPEGADPMDIRYNIIQWVHRATRGWSWGDAVIDPRTGEIVKGHVALGSLRVRQDYLLAQGLIGNFDTTMSDADTPDPMLEMALARIRQLAAHEVGHTLGINHNFAASVRDRASVMDYPAPLATLDGDRIVLDQAYAVGVGDWDKAVVRWGYSVFPDGADEKTELEALLQQQRDDGLRYISDSDARPTGGAHPDAHLWDNGDDVVAALAQDMNVRRIALGKFGLQSIQDGRPVAMLEEILVPLYLRHRYQLEAVSKLIAGVSYEYAVSGSEFDSPQVVPSATQAEALLALLAALQPAALEIPKTVRELIPPRPPGYPENRELFSGETSIIFDAYTPAVGLADFVLGLIADPARAARLVDQNIADSDQSGLTGVLSAVTSFVFEDATATSQHQEELKRLVQTSWVKTLMQLITTTNHPSVAAAADFALQSVASRMKVDGEATPDGIHQRWLRRTINRFNDRSFDVTSETQSVSMPPGSPIGSMPNFKP